MAPQVPSIITGASLVTGVTTKLATAPAPPKAHPPLKPAVMQPTVPVVESKGVAVLTPVSAAKLPAVQPAAVHTLAAARTPAPLPVHVETVHVAPIRKTPALYQNDGSGHIWRSKPIREILFTFTSSATKAEVDVVLTALQSLEPKE